MNLLGLVCVLAAAVTTVAGYWQERVRLGRIERMAPADARRYYEAVRSQQERRLTVFVVVLVIASAGALGRLWWLSRGG